MHCTRCQNYDDGAESIGEGDETNSANENDQSDQEVTDIGGFAGLAGCLHKLKSSEKQVDHCIILLTNYYYNYCILDFISFLSSLPNYFS